MALPKIQQPIYQLKLPSDSKKIISYRPYLVKEDKILLQAAESQDETEMASAIRQIVNNCVLDKGFDCLDLPNFDVDFLYMNIRSKSVGEKISQKYTCNAEMPDDKFCTNKFDIVIDINDIITNIDLSVKKDISITPELSVKMKWPTYRTIMDIDRTKSEIDQTYKTLYGSVDYISDKNQSYSIKDTSFDEFVEFIESLTQDQYGKITEFLEKIPTFSIKKEHICESCGKKHEFNYEDPISFFV